MLVRMRPDGSMMKPEPELVCRSAHGPCIDMLMLTRAGAALAAASAMKLDVRYGGGAASARVKLGACHAVSPAAASASGRPDARRPMRPHMRPSAVSLPVVSRHVARRGGAAAVGG